MTAKTGTATRNGTGNSAGNARPWWWSPGPIAFGFVIAAAAAAVLFEDKIVPQKPVDIRDPRDDGRRGHVLRPRPGPAEPAPRGDRPAAGPDAGPLTPAPAH